MHPDDQRVLEALCQDDAEPLQECLHSPLQHLWLKYRGGVTRLLSMTERQYKDDLLSYIVSNLLGRQLDHIRKRLADYAHGIGDNYTKTLLRKAQLYSSRTIQLDLVASGKGSKIVVSPDPGPREVMDNNDNEAAAPNDTLGLAILLHLAKVELASHMAAMRTKKIHLTTQGIAWSRYDLIEKILICILLRLAEDPEGALPEFRPGYQNAHDTMNLFSEVSAKKCIAAVRLSTDTEGLLPDPDSPDWSSQASRYFKSSLQYHARVISARAEAKLRQSYGGKHEAPN